MVERGVVPAAQVPKMAEKLGAEKYNAALKFKAAMEKSTLRGHQSSEEDD